MTGYVVVKTSLKTFDPFQSITGKTIAPDPLDDPPERQKTKKEIFDAKTRQRHEHIGILANSGVSVPKIAKSLKMGDRQVYKVAAENRRNALLKPKAQKNAAKTIIAISQGKPVGTVLVKVLDDKNNVVEKEVDTQLPNPAQSLTAALAIHEQAHPKVTRHESLNVNVDIDPVDLSQYGFDGVQAKAEKPIIDINPFT